MAGKLYLCATPIGNLGDLTPRALEILKTAEIIACEDTRRTWQLLSHFGIPRPTMFSYRQGNEERVTQTVLASLRAGREVALCSDGGYPGISDPGYRLLRACAAEGAAYDVLPGASAVNVALIMSALPTSSFTFRGFPPRGSGAIRNWFAEDADRELVKDFNRLMRNVFANYGHLRAVMTVVQGMRIYDTIANGDSKLEVVKSAIGLKKRLPKVVEDCRALERIAAAYPDSVGGKTITYGLTAMPLDKIYNEAAFIEEIDSWLASIGYK